jgi:hypothetical protein
MASVTSPMTPAGAVDTPESQAISGPRDRIATTIIHLCRFIPTSRAQRRACIGDAEVTACHQNHRSVAPRPRRGSTYDGLSFLDQVANELLATTGRQEQSK